MAGGLAQAPITREVRLIHQSSALIGRQGHQPLEVRRREGGVEAAYAAASEAIAEVRWRLAGPVPRPSRPPAAGRTMPEFESNMPREQFEAMVARIIEYVHAGDAFQVVPSQRWSAPSPVEAFSIYRGLRAVNPSPYMYFLDFGDFEVAGASPESGKVVTLPRTVPTVAKEFGNSCAIM